MSQKDDFQTIDPCALATVAGGTSTSSSTTGSDDQVLTALTSILNSLQTLNQNHNQQGGFGVPEMLMLFTLMRNNQAQAAPAANPWAGYPYGYGYYY